MTGNHPKRRRDKDNPYKIYESDDRYYITFTDSQKEKQTFEISKTLYDAFDLFELEDLKYLNIWDRHMEQSEVRETRVDKLSMEQSKSIEDMVLWNIHVENLHKAIKALPELQRKRLMLYFFCDFTYEEIAKAEGCSKVAVKYSIDHALKTLKKILE